MIKQTQFPLANLKPNTSVNPVLIVFGALVTVGSILTLYYIKKSRDENRKKIQ